jgi:hypothetical protein
VSTRHAGEPELPKGGIEFDEIHCRSILRRLVPASQLHEFAEHA